jgi:hypothetical protein
MSLFLEAVFWILVVEVFAFVILISPIPFKVQLTRALVWPFTTFPRGVLAFVLVLVVIFVDSVRTVLSKMHNHDHKHDLLLLTRAQRNGYISFFALFLLLVLKSYIALIQEKAQLETQFDTHKKMHNALEKQIKNRMTDKQVEEEVASLAATHATNRPEDDGHVKPAAKKDEPLRERKPARKDD